MAGHRPQYPTIGGALMRQTRGSGRSEGTNRAKWPSGSDNSYLVYWQYVKHLKPSVAETGFKYGEYTNRSENAILVPTCSENGKKTTQGDKNLLDFA
jgi:hypothetical protein